MTVSSSEYPFVVAALYKFAPLDKYESMQKLIYKACQQHEIKGIILLASEGINGTISGTREGIDGILAYIRSLPHLEGLSHKESFSSKHPFRRLRVRLKKEIVTLGVPGVNPAEQVGTYVKPAQWNALLQDPDVLVLDTRNDYEVRIGAFEGAIDPMTKTFRDFPSYVQDSLDPKKHKKVAMYCTGGIRCEKASSYMLQQGFETVYHLEGGILKYLEEIPAEESLWKGDCFVFDQRVAVKQGLLQGDHSLCFGCRQPLTEEDKTFSYHQEGICCRYCYTQTNDRHIKRVTERQRQIQLADLRKENHLG